MMVAFGGALGSAAYALNAATYQSELPIPLKVLLNLVASAVSMGLWLLIMIAIQGASD